MTNFWMRLTEAPTVFLLEPTARKFLLLPFLIIFNYIFITFNVQNSIDNEWKGRS